MIFIPTQEQYFGYAQVWKMSKNDLIVLAAKEEASTKGAANKDELVSRIFEAYFELFCDMIELKKCVRFCISWNN